MALYPRERYLERLRPFYDDAGLIKVITGIRRCGKSSLMACVADELRNRGVDGRNIIMLNLDSRELRKVTTADQLDAAIESRIPDEGFVYLFIDEVQNVSGFENVVNAYREDGRFSIFITGSNSYLLSGELATKLTGRYVELEMYTLSYGEYLGMKSFIGISSNADMLSFNDYLTYGGFPKALEYSDPDAKAMYVQDVIQQIFDKDITARSRISNRDSFNRVQTYLINNYASPTNLTRIAQYLQHSEHVIIKRETLAKYVRMLENAKVIYKCPRFDLKSRRSLRGGEKYYIADPGVYFARNIDVRLSYGPALENAMYLHLRAKGYEVSVGRIGKLECDFIVRKRGRYAYIQVSMSVLDPSVEEREYRPFTFIRDGFPQYLFTLDQLPLQRDGVRHHNLMDFLANDGDIEFE